MTTAHRPTFNPAKGGGAEHGYWSSGGAVSSAFSSLDLPAHTKLKFRQPGQATSEELQRKDLRAELEQKEQQEAVKSGKLAIKNIEEEERKVNVPLLLTNRPEIDEEKLAAYDDRDQVDDRDDFGSSESESDDDDDDDDEDDEEAIQRELERIKREREEARRREEEERLVAEEQAKQEAAMQGNPLMNLGAGAGAAGSAKIKRRWNDDVIFRNQAKAEPGVKKRFVNDTIRNDFHKSFLNKYMK